MTSYDTRLRPYVGLHGSRVTLGWCPVSPIPPIGGLRAPVREFSAASRGRLLNLVARWSVPEDGEELLFITLTYPEEFPSDGRVAKGHLKVFHDWVRYHFPLHQVVWKREYQRRGATHFHLLARLVPGRRWVVAEEIAALQESVRVAWARIVNPPTEAGRLVICDVRPVAAHAGRRAGAALYMGSYLGKKSAKGYQDVVPVGEWAGRFWGVWGGLDLLPEVSLRVEPLQFEMLFEGLVAACEAVGLRPPRRDRGGQLISFRFMSEVSEWLLGHGLDADADDVQDLVDALFVLRAVGSSVTSGA